MDPADLLKETGFTVTDALAAAIRDAMSTQSSWVEAALSCQDVDEVALLKHVGNLVSLPWWAPNRDEVSPVNGEAEQIMRRQVPAELALRHRMLPVGLDGDEEGGSLHIALYDAFNLPGRQQLTATVERPVCWHLTTRSSIVDGLQKFYGVGADTLERIMRGRAEWSGGSDEREETNSLSGDEGEEASVVQFVNQILKRGLDQRATDIHIEPQHDRLRIRYRVDGRLEEVPVPDQIKALQSSVVSRIKIMSRLDIAEKRLPQDGRINLEFGGVSIDVRVATIPSVEGESISMRLLGRDQITLSKLGLDEALNRRVKELLRLPNGIILVTGPTGSGKSTSLYAFLTELNDVHRRIVTIEDPVEYKLPGIMQIAVKSEIGLTFASGLRSILRSDPNVVMIGEMRDMETAEIAIRAALTGHLVFSTLHTNDAVGGITRLADMGVEPFLISSSVRAFFAQRLVRRLCHQCRTPIEVSPVYLERIGFSGHGSSTFMKGVGCAACRGTGFQGRLPIFELCEVTQGLQHLVAMKAPPAVLLEQALKDGYQPMRHYGFLKAMAGETTIEEVLSVTASSREAESAVATPAAMTFA